MKGARAELGLPRGLAALGVLGAPAALAALAAVAALAVSPLGAPAARAAGAPGWQSFADCAAGYRANWKDRLSDPSRPPEMRDTIKAQSDDYEAAAVRRYRAQTGASEAAAKQAVAGYVADRLADFVAMDKGDKLNDFLDRCPQPDAQPASAGGEG